MLITDQKDLHGIMAIGRICGMALAYVISQAEAGISAAELDAMAGDFLKQHHARSAPILMYRFPGNICVSINDEAAHGVPRADKILQPGDLVNIDVSAEKDGYWADCGMSICLPPHTPQSANA